MSFKTTLIGCLMTGAVGLCSQVFGSEAASFVIFQKQLSIAKAFGTDHHSGGERAYRDVGYEHLGFAA